MKYDETNYKELNGKIFYHRDDLNKKYIIRIKENHKYDIIYNGILSVTKTPDQFISRYSPEGICNYINSKIWILININPKELLMNFKNKLNEI